jgi:uncharacterized protein involved in type VI secretion and phage assembly
MTAATERILADLLCRVEGRYFGKYRGLVVDNADPEELGRLRVRVPSVLGADVVTGWAQPCVPYGGSANTGLHFIPDAGAGVWVEFEEGDLEFPVWVGTFWSKPRRDNEVPHPNAADGSQAGGAARPSRKVIKTSKGHTLQFEDADGRELVTLVEAAHGHVVTLDGRGITLTDGLSGHTVVLDAEGISISDGRHAGNRLVMDATGTTVSDAHGHSVVLGAAGIQVGSTSATEAMVLGTTFSANVASFLQALATHTHMGNMGAPTSPPLAPLPLQVPLSPKHRVE